MVMVALIVVGGLVVLVGLADLTDYLLVRAGKRSVLYRRVIRDPRIHARGTWNSTTAGAQHLENSPPGQ